MNVGGNFVAIDWGTSNRRAYLIGADGAVLATWSDDRGVLSLGPDDFPREISSLRQRWGVEPVMIAGMAGSSRGWLDVPYVHCPADATSLAQAMIPAPLDGVMMIPGVAQISDTHCDVMRGEEVQVFGAINAGLAPPDALFCQPGTHNKWIRTRQGRIADFVTVMTGELYSLLLSHGIFAGMLVGDACDGAAFQSGVERGVTARSLGAALFEIRASVLLGQLEATDAAAFASGVLIGNDLAACDDVSNRTVHLLSSGSLADLYCSAIERRGGAVVSIDSRAAFAAGVRLLRESGRC